MTLTIPDDVLEQAGLTQQGVLIEFASRLFDAGKLTLSAACRLAGLSRDEFQAELHARNITVFRPTVQDYRDDVEALRRMGQITR